MQEAQMFQKRGRNHTGDPRTENCGGNCERKNAQRVKEEVVIQVKNRTVIGNLGPEKYSVFKQKRNWVYFPR